jgi:O-antigen/teichoic acid export membrane protein
VARPLLGPGANRFTVVLVALAASATACFRLASSQLRWLMRPWSFLACSVLQAVASALVSIWLLVVVGAGVHALFWGVIVGNALGFVLALWAGREGIGLALDAAKLRRMLTFSLPLVASSAAVWLTLYADRLAIKGLLTMNDLGLYGAAYRFAAAIDMVMVAFEAAFMPIVYATYRDPETPSTLAKLLRLMVLLGIALLLGLAAYSRELLFVLTSQEYAGAAVLVPILAGGVLLTRLSTLAPGLWIANRTASIAWINVGISVGNLSLNLLLIPVLGVAGAALATVLAGALGLAVNLRASHAHYPVPHQWMRLVGGLLLGAIGSAALMKLSNLFEPLSIEGVAIKGLAAAAIAGAALLLLFSGFERAQLVRTVQRFLKA